MEERGLRRDDNLDLLKFNYEKLHESVWNNHKISWTVTSIFIPVLFAVQGYFVKEYYTLQDFQIVLGVVGMEFLLFIWLMIMRIFRHYNDARRDQLKEIEKIFADNLSLGIGFKLYDELDYKENWKKLYFSPMTIYHIFFWAHTAINAVLVSTVMSQSLQVHIAVLIAFFLIGGTLIIYVRYYKKKKNKKEKGN